ncbi:hypothetical protein KAU15_03020, partial [candidate division WOR-3 bacterium]|nr:hypothetical protein [candidate division WOR-3 bacterium]
MTYNELLKEYMNDHYIYGDSFSKYLKEHNYETFEIVFNDIELQKKWSSENGFGIELSLKDILFNQIKAIKPDIIFWDGFEDYNFVNYVKDNVKSIKLNFSQIGVPISNMKRFEPYDFVLSCLKPQVKQLKEYGKKAVFFRHGFDESVLNDIDYDGNPTNFSFIGSIYSGSGAHQERANYIEYLTSYTDIIVYSSFKNSGMRKKIKYKTKKLVSAMYNRMPLELKNRNIYLSERMNCWRKEIPGIIIDEKSVSKFKKSIFGMDMLQTLANSKVSLNVHIDIAGDYAASIRMYEITGVGT